MSERTPAEEKLPVEPSRPRVWTIERIVLLLFAVALVVAVAVHVPGIWRGEDHTVLVRIGGLEVRWYGLLLMSGALAGALVGEWEARRRGLNPDHVWSILLWGLILGVLVSRLWFIVGDWSVFSGDPLQVIGIRDGQFVGLQGLTIHGALFGAVLAVALYVWRKKLNFFTWLDVGGPGFVMGQAVGRWGNFFNLEAFGRPTTLPWGLAIPPSKRLGLPGLSAEEQQDAGLRFHPTFLYESLLNLAICAFLLFLARRYGKRLIPGEIFWFYGMLYAVGRFCLEFLRVDSITFGDFPAAQIVSVGLFVVCAGLLVARRWIWKPKSSAEEPAAVAAAEDDPRP